MRALFAVLLLSLPWIAGCSRDAADTAINRAVTVVIAVDGVALLVRSARGGLSIGRDNDRRAVNPRARDSNAAGASIPGEDFFRGLLRIWLGDQPVQDDLKKALLGAP